MRPVPTLRLLTLSAVATAGFYVVATHLYVPLRQREVLAAFERLQAEQPNAATEMLRDFKAKGVAFPPDVGDPPPLSADALGVFERVAAVEALAREFNRSLGEVKKDLWGANTTKAETDGRLLPSREYPMIAGGFQAAGLTLVLLAGLILIRLRLDIGREYRAIRRNRELSGLGQGLITPTMAALAADKLHHQIGLTDLADADRERHAAIVIQAHKLLRHFARTGDTVGYDKLLTDELEQNAGIAAARFSWVLWIIFAAPTLKLLATLFYMSVGMSKAINPANLPEVISSISEGFSATIVSLLLLLPLMLAKNLVAGQLSRLAVKLKDVGEEFASRFRSVADPAECGIDALWHVPLSLPPVNARVAPPPEPPAVPPPMARKSRRSRWKSRIRTRARVALDRLRVALGRLNVAGRQSASLGRGLVSEFCLWCGTRLRRSLRSGRAGLRRTAAVLARWLAVSLESVGDLFMRASRRFNNSQEVADTNP